MSANALAWCLDFPGEPAKILVDGGLTRHNRSARCCLLPVPEVMAAAAGQGAALDKSRDAFAWLRGGRPVDVLLAALVLRSFLTTDNCRRGTQREYN